MGIGADGNYVVLSYVLSKPSFAFPTEHYIAITAGGYSQSDPSQKVHSVPNRSSGRLPPLTKPFMKPGVITSDVGGRSLAVLQ